MFVAKRFLSGLLEEHGEHPVSTDGGNMVPASMLIPEVGASYPFLL